MNNEELIDTLENLANTLNTSTDRQQKIVASILFVLAGCLVMEDLENLLEVVQTEAKRQMNVISSFKAKLN